MELVLGSVEIYFHNFFFLVLEEFQVFHFLHLMAVVGWLPAPNFTLGAGETYVEVTSIESVIKFSKTKVEPLENLDVVSIEKIRQIGLCIRGQCCNELWHLCRKGVITTSKAHEVITEMKKFRKGDGCVVNIWSLKEKMFGM